MTDTVKSVHLVARIFVDFEIKCKTGLHIGGSPGTLAIGNVDNPVIRDPLTGQPYIPGSSLRGKMRSQLEKDTGVPQNQSIGRDVKIHICQSEAEYERPCPVCKTFGLPGEKTYSETSRLIVRDAFLKSESAERLNNTRTDLPYTEVKWEAAIDRVTSAATPRQQERVPAGAVFCGSLTFSLYGNEEVDFFSNVVRALQLVEEDYLGGQGARGSGQVEFINISIALRGLPEYEQRRNVKEGLKSISELEQALPEITNQFRG